jgi:hypothetical protein
MSRSTFGNPRSVALSARSISNSTQRAISFGVLGGIVGGLVGCGVPAQPNAQRIPVDRISLAVQQPERSVTSFVLVGGSRLYGRPDCIPLTLDLKRSAVAEMANLRKPLSADDAVNFDSSVNRYELSVDSIDTSTGTVTIDVTKAPGFKVDYLAIGQVVLSLTSIKGLRRVGMVERLDSGKTVLPSVKIAGLVDASGVKNGELLLPASKDSFTDAVESALVPFYFFVDVPGVGTRLRLSSKYVTGFDSTDPQKIQAGKYLSELDLGPTGETASEKLNRKKFDLGAQVEQTDENGTIKLTVSSDFDALSSTDQALALGQLLLTLELIPSFSELPPVEFYVSPQMVKENDGLPKPSVPTDSTTATAQRRTRVPNADGVMVEREFLSPRDYDTLVSKEISSPRECR